jgi:hypothetical protein
VRLCVRRDDEVSLFFSRWIWGIFYTLCFMSISLIFMSMGCSLFGLTYGLGVFVWHTNPCLNSGLDSFLFWLGFFAVPMLLLVWVPMSIWINGIAFVVISNLWSDSFSDSLVTQLGGAISNIRICCAIFVVAIEVGYWKLIRARIEHTHDLDIRHLTAIFVFFNFVPLLTIWVFLVAPMTFLTPLCWEVMN